jgi:hypothetical protein
MILQRLVTVGIILLCVVIATPAVRYRSSGRVGWLIANGLVALTGVLSLWLAPDSTLLLTLGLFVLLIVCPIILVRQAAAAAGKGQLDLAARFQRLAALLHPSPHMRFRAVLSEALKAAGPNGEAAALAEIEATGAPHHRTLARLPPGARAPRVGAFADTHPHR